MEFLDLGLSPYRDAWQVQQDLHDKIKIDEIESTVIFVEHPSVLTLGQNSGMQHVMSKDIDIVQIDRGGDVTAHNPGQLVVYPILNLQKLNLMPKKYIFALEEIVIKALAHFDIQAARDDEYPGVWVGKNKICAVGVRIKDRATMHGIALNVCNDLSIFNLIIPCGIQGRSVTSIQALTGRMIKIDSVKELIKQLILTEPSFQETL